MTKTGEPLFVATMYREYLPQHGMYVAVSLDGIHFTNLVGHNSPLYAPESGVRDPAILFYEGQFWLAYSYGWPPKDLAAYLYLATSPDLVTWTFRVAIRVSEDTGASVDVPQWLIDSSGTVHLIGCIGATHHWVEIHAKSQDSSTWNAASNWSEKRDILDHRGTSLIQGNSFVTRSAGTWYMIFDPFTEMTMGLIDGRYYLRTSSDLVANWSDARLLDLDSIINNGDAENVLFLPNGDVRCYVSNGNSKNYQIWCVDSSDRCGHWTSPRLLEFAGYRDVLINWAQVAMLTDPDAIEAIRASLPLSSKKE